MSLPILWGSPTGKRIRAALSPPLLLREMALLGGLAALFLAPVRPEHWHHVPELLWGFLAYKLGGLAAAGLRPAWLDRVRLTTRSLDYLFVFLLVWFTGGTLSQFYLLYMLLVSLDAYEGGRSGGLAAAAFSAALYGGDQLLLSNGRDWAHFAAHAGLFFTFGTALGWLSDRERAARAATEEALRELQLTQGKLVQSERLATVGRMTSKVAHEIRNPLGAITLNLDLLREMLLPEGKAGRLVAATKEQVEALSGITEEYLQFGRLAHLRMEEVDPVKVASGVIAAMEPELVGRGATVKFEAGGPLPPLVADPRLLRQALINLIKNAGEAAGPGGTVWVGAAAAEADIEFWVGDDGPGVPSADVARIFEPFYTTKPGGTGLGLAVVQQVALEHGGTVRCESRPGGGARFVLGLPRRAAARQGKGSHVATNRAGGG